MTRRDGRTLSGVIAPGTRIRGGADTSVVAAQGSSGTGTVVGASKVRRRLMVATAISLGAAACGAPALARASVGSPGAGPRRIVVLNWSLTEMVLSLGVTPVGVPAPAWYTSSVVEPPLPAGIVDLGLLFQPNYDLLYELKPDLILITPAHSSVRASFERIAPTMTLGAYAMSPTPYQAMRLELMTLARRLGLEARGQSLLDATDGVLERARGALVSAAPGAGYPDVCVAELADDRHIRVYGKGSQFDDMVQALGLRNLAAPGAIKDRAALVTSRTGDSVIELTALAPVTRARMLWLGPGSPGALANLARNPLWQRLPIARGEPAAVLPVVTPSGGPVSMQRFARALTNAMLNKQVV